MSLLVSIITPVLNKRKTVESAILSILQQKYGNIEHIIVDGGSTDGTIGIIKKYSDKITLISVDDESGVYAAINIGLKSAKGEIIGILNADDFYTNKNVIGKVVNEFQNRPISALYGDLVYVKADKPDHVIRYWRAGNCSAKMCRRGWMPPHPTFFVRKELYEKLGYFDTSFKIAADYEIMTRFLYKNGIPVYYLPEVMVKMRWGGISNGSIKSIVKKTAEDYRVCQRYKLGFCTLLMKNLNKLPQFLHSRGL